MSPPQNETILQQAEELGALAAGLETECATWTRHGVSDDPKFPSRAYEAMREEETRQSNVVWDNAVAAGHLLCNLCDIGAFDRQARLKNIVGHLRAEMARARGGNKPPVYYFVVNLPYHPKNHRDTYDVFFVKLFEGFCKILAKSLEDRRAFDRCYVKQGEKAVFHTRIMRTLSSGLKTEFGTSPRPDQ